MFINIIKRKTKKYNNLFIIKFIFKFKLINYFKYILNINKLLVIYINNLILI